MYYEAEQEEVAHSKPTQQSNDRSSNDRRDFPTFKIIGGEWNEMIHSLKIEVMINFISNF